VDADRSDSGPAIVKSSGMKTNETIASSELTRESILRGTCS
jgi:hypothetical protein